MAYAWTPEHVIDEDTALALVNEQFPELAVKSIKLLGVGWDNTVYLLNEQYVFRFPRKEIAAKLLETEFASLPKIAGKLPIVIPVPKWFGKSSEKFQWPFIGYEILPGKTACYKNLSDKERAVLAEPLANFLKALHSINAQEFNNVLQADQIGRVDALVRIPKTRENLKELESLGLLKNKKELYKILDDASNLRPAENIAVCHGDIYVRHLLVDENNKLTGIIDWGDIHIGDPAGDLSIAHSFLPPSAHENFRRAYGNITEETWKLAQFKALYLCSVLVVYGTKSNDSFIANEGLKGLEYIAMSA